MIDINENFNPGKLLKALKEGRREAAWKAVLPLIPATDPSAKLLQGYLNELRTYAKKAKRPRFYVPKQDAGGRICRGCHRPVRAHKEPGGLRYHMFCISMAYWVRRWWSDKDINERRARTAKARQCRITKRWEPKLAAIPYRLRTQLGDDECIRRLKRGEPVQYA